MRTTSEILSCPFSSLTKDSNEGYHIRRSPSNATPSPYCMLLKDESARLSPPKIKRATASRLLIMLDRWHSSDVGLSVLIFTRNQPLCLVRSIVLHRSSFRNALYKHSARYGFRFYRCQLTKTSCFQFNPTGTRQCANNELFVIRRY